MNVVVIIIVSLLFSALFSGMEIAFVSSSKLRFEMDKKDNNLTSTLIDFFYRHSEMFITTMLVGNNIALVVYGIQTARLLNAPIEQYVSSNPVAVVTIQTVISTVVVLFTGEFIPKTIFKSRANFWLLFFSPIIFVIYILLYPVTLFASALSKIILRIAGQYNPQEKSAVLNKIDLDYLVTESIESVEKTSEVENDMKLFQNALDFSNVKLKECAVPRTEIMALNYSSTYEDLRNAFTETGYSKILIFKDNIDNIIGYFHSSDLFQYAKDGDKFDWHHYLRKMPIVPETMSASKLMDILVQNKKSIAVVVDEFGGTAGIVTLEDIMEEIFGEIEDEHDTKEYRAEKISDKEYLLSGRLEIDEVNQKFELELPEDENYLTIAGFILYYYQKFPKLNETITIDNYTFKIVEAHNNRIDLVQLKINR
ncbi:MAG: hemolysin family protein [Paludibacteraceae bacterium]|nr:HlyC/CorC family transporter [Candidatus Colousia faecequi]MCQ2337966.1 hemolysin family protein [Paludibacteraceae bacterium]